MLIECDGRGASVAYDCSDPCFAAGGNSLADRAPCVSRDASIDAARVLLDGQVRADAQVDARTDAQACLPLPCPSAAPWNAALCRCELDGQACNGPGNYFASKGESEGPCCAGLHTVYQLMPTYGGGAALPVCMEPVGAAIYACVEGVCGDDRCEAAESVPCGCKLDCPSAAFGADASVP